MEITQFVLVAATFATIGGLPMAFFGGDRNLNIRWWLTAAPFFIAPMAVAALFLGRAPSWTPPVVVADGLAIAASLAAVASIGLIAYTLGTHRRPIALWHQTNDAPKEIVTWGAYSHIRHPFYTAFHLALGAAALTAPSVVTAGCLAWGCIALVLTARREERRLLASRFGADYGVYMQRTGRFLPRLR